jgi:hypothetical protein
MEDLVDLVKNLEFSCDIHGRVSQPYPPRNTKNFKILKICFFIKECVKCPRKVYEIKFPDLEATKPTNRTAYVD